jgi:hypothetical protein
VSGNDNINTLKYPPLSPDELKDAHGYNNIVRVVVTQNGIYGLSKDGGWIGFKPLSHTANTPQAGSGGER